MLRTPDGKWVLFHTKTGKQIERWSVDARAMIATGEYTTEVPAGVVPDIPAAAPRSVQPPPPPPPNPLLAAAAAVPEPEAPAPEQPFEPAKAAGKTTKKPKG